MSENHGLPETSAEMVEAFDGLVNQYTNDRPAVLTDQQFDLICLALACFTAMRNAYPDRFEFCFQGARNSLRAAEIFAAKYLGGTKQEGK